MNWSIPKSPDQATTFLHFHASESIANLQSNIFSHFIFHLMNLLYKLSSTVQFILGPSIYGTYALVGGWCCLMDTSCSLFDSCSKLVSSSGRTVLLVCGSHWAFLFALGILVLLYLWSSYKLSLYLFLMWFSLLLYYVVAPYLFQASDGCFTLWLPMVTFIFLLAVLRNTLFSSFLTALSVTSYLLAWPLRLHALLLFTSIGHLVSLLGTLYYSCTGLFLINLEQYLLWVI